MPVRLRRACFDNMGKGNSIDKASVRVFGLCMCVFLALATPSVRLQVVRRPSPLRAAAGGDGAGAVGQATMPSGKPARAVRLGQHNEDATTSHEQHGCVHGCVRKFVWGTALLRLSPSPSPLPDMPTLPTTSYLNVSRH